MARQKRSPIVSAKNFVARLPWPAWGGLAAISFALLNYFPGTLAMDAMPELLGYGAAERAGGLALIRYVLPALFLLVAVVSCVRSSQSRKPTARVADTASPDALAALSRQEFDALLAKAFVREGYLAVERAGVRGGDHGVDLELFMGRDRYLVLSRCWRESKVDVAAVRELYRAMSAERAVGGFIVTSGKFTDEARSLALGRAIRLVPAESLRMMLASVGEMSIFPSFSRRRGDPVPPACPLCGKAMMSRMAHRGERAGKLFWGCTSFPACRGFREI